MHIDTLTRWCRPTYVSWFTNTLNYFDIPNQVINPIIIVLSDFVSTFIEVLIKLNKVLKYYTV